MAAKVVVIIATAEEQKALTGLMYASKNLTEGWLDDVKVVFLGPSERLLVSSEEIAKAAKEMSAEHKPLACKFVADNEGITEKIEAMGLKVEYVGTIIADLLKDGYLPMVF